MRAKNLEGISPSLFEKNGNKHPNNLGDPAWYIHDEDKQIRRIDFSEWECSDDKTIWAQSFILRRADGYVNNDQKIVVSDQGTWNPIINKLRDLCEYWELNHSRTPLSRWTETDVVSFLKYVMLYVDDEGDICVRHHGQEEGYRHILYRSHQYFMDASIVDGLRVEVSKRFSESLLEPYLSKSGMSLGAWLKGGSLGSIPIENGMVVLASAIQLLESPHANAARAYFKFIRDNHDISAANVLSSKDNLFVENRIYNSERSDFKVLSAKRAELKLILNKELAGESVDFFKQGAFSAFVAELYAAATYILLVLSGFRISEWTTFNTRDFIHHKDGTWEFRNQIHKTNYSIKAPRYLHGMTAFALNTLIECSYVDKMSENAPVFLRSFRCSHLCTLGKRATLSDLLKVGIWGEHPENTIRGAFQKFYRKVINQHPELASIHSETSPHQARHLWAEYCIRRFDGAVVERISEHFRHRLSDNFIRAYYEKALRERERDAIENSYIEEILRSIGGSDESMIRLYGPAAKRARMELNKASVISPDDFELTIANLSESIIITVDEWGYCLLRKGEEQYAKCFNKDLGTTMVEELRSFEVCASCIHSCNTKLQRVGIERSLIAHEEFIEALPLELSRLADASRKHIRVGESRLKEMDNE